MDRSGTGSQKRKFRNFPEFKSYLAVKIKTIPWWLVGIILIAIGTVVVVVTKENYRDAFNFIKAGIGVTISITIIAYFVALILGLLTGFGRISNNLLFKNLATLYVEIIRGIPMLVLIFFIAFVGVPIVVDLIKALGTWFTSLGMTGLGSSLSSLENNAVSMSLRAIIALSVTYGAFLAEIFGLESSQSVAVKWKPPVHKG